jgi:hypothetical protein
LTLKKGREALTGLLMVYGVYDKGKKINPKVRGWWLS